MLTSAADAPADPSVRLRAVLAADWVNAVFLHFAVEPSALAPWVPLELDLHEGRAYVSLVAFSQKKLRLAHAPRCSSWIGKLFGNHDFLNLRAYVRRGSESGIFFLAEWVQNRLAALAAPGLYGLPYRLGQLRYRLLEGSFSADVEAGQNKAVRFTANWQGARFSHAPPGSLADFLLERYVAFTCRKGKLRRFRVAHEPWLQAEARVEIRERTLLDGAGPWGPSARLAAAHRSPGVERVRIGGPELVAD